jgi:hypothetical protein
LFFTSDLKYALACGKEDENSEVFLLYLDKDVTAEGTHTFTYEGATYTNKSNASLKKGWNYCIDSYNEATKTWTFTASTTLPSGYKWFVIDQ